MEISTLNAASAYGAAAHATQMNHAAALALQTPIFPPGNSLDECIDFVFSDKFRKFINVSHDAPPLKVVESIRDYASACVCKIYNETYVPLKDKPLNFLKNTPPAPTKPPRNVEIHSIKEIPALTQNLADYYFKVFVPEIKPRLPESVADGMSQSIFFEQKFANTFITIEAYHYYANKDRPAQNVVSASARCSGDRIGWANADSKVVDLVKDLVIHYFKKMNATVYVNDERI